MDDTLSFFLSRGADEEVATRFSSVRPTLTFRCRHGKFDAYINVRSSVDFDYQSYRTSVRLRFDDNPPKREDWSVSTDREALFVPNPERFLNSLIDTVALQFEWRQLGGGLSVARFARDDLDNHAVQFADRCGNPKLVRKSSDK